MIKKWIVISIVVVLIVVLIGWLFGPLAGIGSALTGIGGWIFGRKSSDNTERARREAQLELDAAVARGLKHIETVDEAAKDEVNRVTAKHDLDSYLLARDPGPDDDDGTAGQGS